MGLAYLVFSHQLPAQTGRLLDRLLVDADDVAWVHVDAHVELDGFRAAAGGALDRPGVHLLPRLHAAWGTYGFNAATIVGIRAALASGHPFSHLSLLSGQDYPLRPRDELAALLAGRPDDGFLEHFPLPGPGPGDEVARVTHRFYTVAGVRFSLPNRYMPFPPARKVPGGRVPYKGSAWWTLPRAMLERFIATVDAEPALERLFKRSFIPDEAMIHTVLANTDARDRLDQDHLRFIEFEERAFNPRVLTVADLPRLRESGAYFARKFDERVDAEVMDRIDRDLLSAGVGRSA